MLLDIPDHQEAKRHHPGQRRASRTRRAELAAEGEGAVAVRFRLKRISETERPLLTA
jgi:hypothetical protein